MIRIAPNLELPDDAVTQTFGILAVRGAGKSNLAAVMAEGMWKARLPFVVVDPVGSWWGLRSTADGRAGGLAIPIFGGRHGDVALEKTGGQVLADLVVDDRASCVLDVSEFSEADKIRFLIDFAERLYRRNEEPLHLFLEEADDYIPQRPFREQARLLGAFERIQRRGRARGLGSTLVTQRSAALNKNVLTQIETLFVLRTTSPHDRKAIEGWVEYHGQKRELLESLPGLATGEAWVWSPQWLGVMKRIQTRRRATFDSAATPKNVKGGRPGATLADVDLGKVRKQMAATIERAKQEDPRELKRRISELERGKSAAVVETKVVERNVVKPADVAAVEKLIARIEKIVDRLGSAGVAIGAEGSRLASAVATARTPVHVLGRIHDDVRTDRVARARELRVDATALGQGERRVLVAIAQHADGVTREQLTMLTGYKRSSRDTYVSRLVRGSLVTVTGDGWIHVTGAGVQTLGPDFERLPTGDALREYWLTRLSGGEKKILEAIVAAYPKAVTRTDISAVTTFQRSSRDTYITRLKRRHLVDTPSFGEVRASEELFG